MFTFKRNAKIKNTAYVTEPEMTMLRNVAVGVAVTLAEVQGGGTYKVTAQNDANTVLDDWKIVESNLLVYL